MITVYGTVSEIEWTTPPPPPPEVEPQGYESSPANPAEEAVRQAERALRESLPVYRAVEAPTPRAGEEPAKTWVHVHVKLDAPHSGEITVECPEVQVGGMLLVGGRARLMVASN
jgi:hypothetical protein